MHEIYNKGVGVGKQKSNMEKRVILSYPEATATRGLAHRPALMAEWL